MVEPYPKSVPGPFYVENECCLTCGIPHERAPDLFAWDVKGKHDAHCYVARQPQTEAEMEQMFEVLRAQDLGCVRYRGTDPEILKRLRDEDCGDLCDETTS